MPNLNNPKDTAEHDNKSSYGQIVKSSSIMGGAAGLSMLFAMLRAKFAAVLIGTVGVGLLASFISLQNMIGTLAGLGLQSSAVRDIVTAIASNDEVAVGRAVLTLRRLCWFTGLIGMLVMMGASPWLSQLMFDKSDYAMDISLLGIAILLANISGGQIALLQGMRRIGDMARINVISAAVGTVSAILLYWLWGFRGIVPTLLIVAMMQLACSWWYARNIPVPEVVMNWHETFYQAGNMVKLGIAMMFSVLITSMVSLMTISLIGKQQGIAATGIYSAAFSLSGLFVGFVLQAMGADYYPRLTGLLDDYKQMTKLVNEQTEIGLLLATPGLLATLVFAPIAIHIFYSPEFISAVDLLQLFVLGCLGRVISWPMGYVILALGKGRLYLITEAIFGVIHLGLIYTALKLYGLVGVAIAFAVMYLLYTLVVYVVCNRLINFHWSVQSLKEVISASMALFIGLLITKFLPSNYALSLGAILVLAVSIVCLRGLVQRLGHSNRIVQLIKKIPGTQFILF